MVYEVLAKCRVLENDIGENNGVQKTCISRLGFFVHFHEFAHAIWDTFMKNVCCGSSSYLAMEAKLFV